MKQILIVLVLLMSLQSFGQPDFFLTKPTNIETTYFIDSFNINTTDIKMVSEVDSTVLTSTQRNSIIIYGNSVTITSNTSTSSFKLVNIYLLYCDNKLIGIEATTDLDDVKVVIAPKWLRIYQEDYWETIYYK